MRAMVLEQLNRPLQSKELPQPMPLGCELLIKIQACALCRTDLHVWNGELPNIHLPLILGHQAIGEVVAKGPKSHAFDIGDLVGAAWLAKSCQHCGFCEAGQENLCDHGTYRGYQINGGFAEYTTADENYIYRIPAGYSAIEAAPFLCGGLIGYRAWHMLEACQTLGYYGFGSSAHLLIQLAHYTHQKVFAFTRPGDHTGQTFAKSLGAVWAGDSDQQPPEPLDGAILFAPVGSLVPAALKAVRKGGVVVCAGIHMSEIPAFSYDLLYGERVLRSVTNLTRADGHAFFELAAKHRFHSHVTTYPLEQATQALQDLKEGKFQGSAVLVIN